MAMLRLTAQCARNSSSAIGRRAASISQASAGPSSSTKAGNAFGIHTSSARAGPWDSPMDASKKLNRYIIIAEDYANAGALARRLEVRDAHLEEAKSGVEAGRIEMGGGLLSRDFGDIDPQSSPVYSLSGSAFVVQGESIDEVQRRVDADQYLQAGVWDPSKIRILPFLPAFVNAPKMDATPQEQHDAVQRRVARHNSRAKPGQARRQEIYVRDPRGSGKAINKADRAQMENSLGALRRRAGPRPPDTIEGGQTKATLTSLRRTSKPPVYEHNGADGNASVSEGGAMGK